MVFSHLKIHHGSLLPVASSLGSFPCVWRACVIWLHPNCPTWLTLLITSALHQGLLSSDNHFPWAPRMCSGLICWKPVMAFVPVGTSLLNVHLLVAFSLNFSRLHRCCSRPIIPGIRSKLELLLFMVNFCFYRRLKNAPPKICLCCNFQNLWM